MARYLIILILAVGALTAVVFLFQCALAVIAKTVEVAARIVVAPFHFIPAGLRAIRARNRHRLIEAERRREELKKIAEAKARHAELLEIESYRAAHPVRVVGGPDKKTADETTALMDNFIAEANSFRPTFNRDTDVRFRSGEYMPLKWMRQQAKVEPAPASCEMSLTDQIIPNGRPIEAAYRHVAATESFPFAFPNPSFSLPSRPVRPLIEIPKWQARVVWVDDGSEVNTDSELLMITYQPEFEEALALTKWGRMLASDLHDKAREMGEAGERMKNTSLTKSLTLRTSKTRFSANMKNASADMIYRECTI